ncbi:hypothetical protein NXS19_004931 [Fusarium pseudograminearum]|nr:hypothetical protein NXS19_004931 [Fusarium pseudograminearum]
MARFTQHIFVLCVAILILHVGSAMADMEPFHVFYREWGFIFERIIHDNCSAEYDIYIDGKMPRPECCKRRLGFDTSHFELSGIRCRGDFDSVHLWETSLFALCLCLGSPGIPPLRLFEHRQLSQPLERRQGRLRLQLYSFGTETLILIAEYVLVFASIANVAQLGHEMASRVVLVFAPHLSYLILLWFFIGSSAHIFAVMSLSLRVRIEHEEVVLMYEIAKIRHLCWAEDPPMLTYENPEDKVDAVGEPGYMTAERQSDGFSLIPKFRRLTTFTSREL